MDSASMTLLRKVTYPPLGDRPVEILESRLYQDDQTMQISLSLTMENRSDLALSSVYLDLCGFDEEVQLVFTKDRVPYANLSVLPGGTFGEDSLLPLASMRVRSITATLHHAVFADGSIWSSKETAPVKEYTEISDEPFPRRRKRKKLRRAIGWGIAALILCGSVGYLGFRQVKVSEKQTMAEDLFRTGQYVDALNLYQELEKGLPYVTPKKDYRYKQALCHIRAGAWSDAVSLLQSQNDHAPSLRLLRQVNILLSGIVSAGENHSVGLCSNGRAYASGDNSFGLCEIGLWKDLASLSAGSNHTLGLTQTGTVLYAGEADRPCGQVEGWTTAVSVAAGENHSVAALSNGRVVTAGDNSLGQCDTKNWSGVIAVAAGKNHTVALRVDGTLLATGDNALGGCNIEDWKDVISISAGDGFTLGVTKDGTLLSAGAPVPETEALLSSVYAGYQHSMARELSGKLISAGENNQHQGQVSHWESILTAAGGQEHTVAICPDGTAVAIGRNTHSQCEVAAWNGIGVPNGALELCSISSEYE